MPRVASFADAIYVLHSFQKKTQKTSQKDIGLASQRYKQIGGYLNGKGYREIVGQRSSWIWGFPLTKRPFCRCGRISWRIFANSSSEIFPRTG